MRLSFTAFALATTATTTVTALQGLPPQHVMGTYKPVFGVTEKLEKEAALSLIKTTFEDNLKENVSLQRVSCPMFLTKQSGFNDNLNGVERPATFAPRDYQDMKLEVPFSLAKWKRWALHYYNVPEGKGIVTDMRGLRCDDDVDFTHSLYVDQWDWEKHISQENRNLEYLKETVRNKYKAVYDTEQAVCKAFGMDTTLPKDIVFATTDEMIAKYPDKSPKERENILTEEHGAVFLIGIGGHLEDGTTLRHDGRAPDYDDWTTPRDDGGTGLNGDLLVWNPLLKQSFELSSMGIRVNPNVMLEQLDLAGCPERVENVWHQMLLDGTLPQTIGGGVGQSRLSQFMLRCAHIGEVQHGWYDPEEVKVLRESDIVLLGLGEFVDQPAAAAALV